MSAGPTLVLASASPRRRELLTRVGIPIEVVPAEIDESERGEPGGDYASRLAREKALRVAQTSHPDRWILGAAPVVIIDGDLLGKPLDGVDAAVMMGRLAGRTHLVLTATCLVAPGGHPVRERIVRSEVEFRPLTIREISAYVASNEWQGKAGGYAIQGIASGLVRAVRGSYTSVVGLPLAEVLEDLALHAADGAPVADFRHGQPA